MYERPIMIKKIHGIFAALLCCVISINAIQPYCFCTAADSRYFNELKNLIGSIHNSHYGVEILVYDLGLSDAEKNELRHMENVTPCDIERTHPDIIKSFLTDNGGRRVPGWFAWKPVLIKQSLDKYPIVLYLDAGTVIMHPINQLFRYIEDHGYFLFDTGCLLAPRMTKFLIESFKLHSPERQWILQQNFMDASLMGFSKNSNAYVSCVMQMYELSRNLDYFKDDGSAPMGFGGARHDQTLFSIISFLNNFEILLTDCTEQEPTPLKFSDGSTAAIYMTYQPQYVCNKTDIYHCRKGAAPRFEQYIHWKK